MAEIEATAVESLGLLYVDQGDRDAAARLLRTNLEVAQEIGEPRRIALAKLHLAKVVDVAESLTLLEQALAFFVENADDEGQNIVKVLIWKAKRLAVHDASQAFAVVMDAAKRADDSKWHVEKGQIYEVFADISLTQGAPEQTKAYLESAVAIYQANGLTSQHLAARDRLAEL
jgi:tetratricopeptide (TPR) repeat protein